jgi:beta-galactosidase
VPGPSSAERWRRAGLDRLVTRTTAAGLDGDDYVVAQRLLPAQGRHGAAVEYRWRTVGDDAACLVHVAPIQGRTAGITWPRIGYRLTLPSAYERASWYGTGPGEAYPDSRLASLVGATTPRSTTFPRRSPGDRPSTGPPTADPDR